MTVRNERPETAAIFATRPLHRPEGDRLSERAVPVTAHVLWTGGWDSTFRVIDACLKSLVIQPHYIIDRCRPSHAIEVLTILLLRQQILQRWPSAQVAPPRLVNRSDIPEDPGISASYRHLRAINKLGGQYDFLARYALMIGGLELCVHQQDKAHRFLAERTKLIDLGDGDPYWVTTDREDEDVARVFSRFRFPVLGMTKLGMQERASQEDFLDILDQTWFCTRPMSDGRPCGLCGPCGFAVEEGLSRRLPTEALRRMDRPMALENRLRRRAALKLKRLADRFWRPTRP